MVPLHRQAPPLPLRLCACFVSHLLSHLTGGAAARRPPAVSLVLCPLLQLPGFRVFLSPAGISCSAVLLAIACHLPLARALRSLLCSLLFLGALRLLREVAAPERLLRAQADSATSSLSTQGTRRVAVALTLERLLGLADDCAPLCALCRLHEIAAKDSHQKAMADIGIRMLML